ncbi:LptF/LptG family permease [Candidatus Palibaumannia cicadellinicola]|uniref:Putative permease n=1 Tax=Candidatus Palibaumannia cicadellinicola TaxID=186490 RepID=A0A088MYB6_9GAMM|nr:LptF/LptG family permease [Candidatus Baumannia cicadellinicola]AIN47204.1 putative permease [Candidatus Baumannia cicadellinicola]
MAEIAQFIILLSFVIDLLIILSHLHAKSEIIAMHACDIGKHLIIQAAFMLSMFTALFRAINVIWLSP